MKKLFFTVACIFLVSFPLIATTTEAMPWEKPLDIFMKSFSGPIPKIIGAGMIVGAGLMMAFTEGQAIKMALWVVIGLGIALNAVSIMSTLFGNANGFIF